LKISETFDSFKIKTKVLNLITLAGIHWQFRAGFKKKKKRFCDVYSQGGDHPKTKFSQFWLHATRYESRKKKPGSFYILGYLLELIVEIRRFGKKKCL
jgi:hypothetical protein